jgi:RNA polymerase sigma-70 factor, ECF subfamily
MVAVIERGSVPTQAEFHEAIAHRADRWYAACLRITRSPELAEDAVQEALLSAWDKRDQFQGDARLETWIHRIAINAALQLIRKQRPGVFEALGDDIEDPDISPEADRHNHDLSDVLGRAMRRLTEFERVCFLLKHLEQWRLTEIATELDSNVSRVKQGLFRGVRKLRETMPDIRSL